ncbi:SseB family protein [Xinfangfangia pollutisoli]|uniref:SseB family protein n=1 Tax=Xinfangfangia pollutisoli TaxID=2865960 RepID=UPI001CD62667|nr:SseB family protein [Xinfangfangia pollutisoli]
MTVVTLLDAAHAALSADPGNEKLQLRFYERLADGELFLLLDREAEGEVLDPRIFPLESGPVVLVFDREERLAEFSGGVAPYAALPGRVIAQVLRGQGVGLGVNLGVAPSEMLLPPEALDWLAETLEGGPEETEAQPEELLPPAVPEALVSALDAKLARAGGLAVAAVLAGVRYQGGRRGHVLGVLGAAPGAEPALARAVREALVFSGIEAGELDVIFLDPDSAVAGSLIRVGLRFDLPQPEAPAARAPQAPGSDPAKPPRLK